MSFFFAFFFGRMGHIDLPITKKSWEHCDLPNISTSLDPSCKIETKCAPLWPTFSTLGKAYEINLRCYREHLGQQLEEPHDGNMMGTHWEQLGGSISFPPARKGKKKLDPYECTPSLLIGCTNLLLVPTNCFVTIFGLG
jgi:hypothetical protein